MTARRLWRAAGLVLVTVAGLGSIVGSGGGNRDAFSDCPPNTDCSAPPSPPSVTAVPQYVTAQVGTAVSFNASPAHFSSAPSYQWSRSDDGGTTFLDLQGANGAAYFVPSVNLADDAALFRVTATIGNATAFATSHLAVAAAPGVVFQDGEFQPPDWLVTPYGDANAAAPVQLVERLPSGGNPGAFRKMTFTLNAQSGAGRVFYSDLAATYDPQTQGAVYVIDYAEDGISLQSDTSSSTLSNMLLEQGGRHYIANIRDPSAAIPTAWSGVSSSNSLSAKDFNLFDGPPCAAGERCPDFSALGGPMRFGYWRISFGVPGRTIAHGIDNWRVTVWRR